MTLLKSVVLGIEPCTILGFRLDLVKPACGVLVVSSRLLLVECLRPKQGTDNQDKRSSGEEL